MKKDHSQKAAELFCNGANCAQAVFVAFAEDCGMSEDVAMKLSSSFGGGMGRLREVCGAASGMFMVAGLLAGYTTDDPKEKKDAHSGRRQIEEMKRARKLELEALTYIRGRSIPQQYLIVDEAQNLTPHEIKTIVSRAGEGTKVVLTGDPNQIDNAYLDSSSNGLSYAAERLKTLSIHGHITLQKSERSELASAAAAYL